MRLLDDLQAGLAAIDAAHLRRVRRTAYSPTDRSQRISVPGEAPRDILGFCGNDYLGLAAHPALAEAMTQKKAVTANTTAKPLSPMVIDFEMEGWLMRILSERTQGQKPHSPSRGID